MPHHIAVGNVTGGHPWCHPFVGLSELFLFVQGNLPSRETPVVNNLCWFFSRGPWGPVDAGINVWGPGKRLGLSAQPGSCSDLISQNSSMPHTPFSRPTPDCL